MKQSKLLMIAAAVTALLLAALPAVGGATAAAKAASGAPIYVGVQTFVQVTSSQSQPEVAPAAEAAVKAINATGGIKGRPLKIVSCDNHFTSAGSAACWQQYAGNSSIVALVGGDDCFTDQSLAIIKASGLKAQ